MPIYVWMKSSCIVNGSILWIGFWNKAILYLALISLFFYCYCWITIIIQNNRNSFYLSGIFSIYQLIPRMFIMLAYDIFRVIIFSFLVIIVTIFWFLYFWFYFLVIMLATLNFHKLKTMMPMVLIFWYSGWF